MRSRRALVAALVILAPYAALPIASPLIEGDVAEGRGPAAGEEDHPPAGTDGMLFVILWL